MMGRFSMGTVLAAVLVAAIMVAGGATSSSVAQMPMSPGYRTGPEPPQPAADDAAPAATAAPRAENAPRAKPDAVAQEPVATAPIPPPVPAEVDKPDASKPDASKPDAGKPDASKPGATAEPGSHPASIPAEKTPSGPVPDAAATLPTQTQTSTPTPSLPASRSATGPGPSRATESPEKRHPAAASEAPPTPPWEAQPGEAVAAPHDGPGKVTTRAARRQTEAKRRAWATRQVRRRGPVYYYAPPAYYARSPYSYGSRGYSGGAYGPSPYSSEGP